MALYTFEALDETTLTVIEGEKLKILQKHDDNMNDEWWLLEKLDENGEFKEQKFIKMPVNTIERTSTSNPHLSELKIPKTSTVENDSPDGPKTR